MIPFGRMTCAGPSTHVHLRPQLACPPPVFEVDAALSESEEQTLENRVLLAGDVFWRRVPPLLGL